jgi:hypothetical protein
VGLSLLPLPQSAAHARRRFESAKPSGRPFGPRPDRTPSRLACPKNQSSELLALPDRGLPLPGPVTPAGHDVAADHGDFELDAVKGLGEQGAAVDFPDGPHHGTQQQLLCQQQWAGGAWRGPAASRRVAARGFEIQAEQVFGAPGSTLGALFDRLGRNSARRRGDLRWAAWHVGSVCEERRHRWTRRPY